jgi:V/A-type H+-transporting ATPase subunit I
MARVRIIGPRDRLPSALEVLQDFGRMQLDRIPSAEGLETTSPDAEVAHHQRPLRRMIDDTETAMSLLGISEAGAPPAAAAASSSTLAPLLAPASSAAADLPRQARFARRVRHQAEALRSRRQTLDEERTLLARYHDFLKAFEVLLAELGSAKHLRAYGVTLPGRERGRVDTLADTLSTELGVEVIVTSRPLPSGDLAVLIAVPAEVRDRMERGLAAARIAEVPVPSGFGESLNEAAPRILARLAEIPSAIDAVDSERRTLASSVGDELRAIRFGAYDRLTTAAASALASATRHAFAIEGWVPRADVSSLRKSIERALGSDMVVEELAREDWHAAEAPVVLSNPRLFKPFEMITSQLPLPAYGSIDPTPFIAVGFPLFFGMILGDVGYGAVLGAIAALILWRASKESRWRTAAEMALGCAMFSIVFGLLFGELFGTLGRRWFGLRPILFDRETAIIGAVVAAVGLGVAHTALGLLLGMIESRRKPRAAAGRAVQLGMLALIVLAVLSMVHVLPSRLFGPLAIIVFVGFPVLVALEGIVAPIEFFSSLTSVLSYVRIMALGTASVLLAAAANEMTGVFGSAIVGVLVGLLFHLMNFAMGLFSPTIHAIRLHYVEFLRTFYSPGGRSYEPFRHRGPHASTIRGSS